MAMLSDNEVAYVAEMQQKIDTLVSFVFHLKEMIDGNNGAKFVQYCDIECLDEMIDIRNFVEEAVNEKK